MIAQRDVAARRVVADVQKHETETIPQDAWKHGDASPSLAGDGLDIAAIASQRESSSWQALTKPGHIGLRFQRGVHHDQVMAFAGGLRNQRALAFKILGGGEQPVSNVSELALDDFGFVEARQPEDEVRLTAMQIDDARIALPVRW